MLCIPFLILFSQKCVDETPVKFLSIYFLDNVKSSSIVLNITKVLIGYSRSRFHTKRCFHRFHVPIVSLHPAGSLVNRTIFEHINQF